MNYYKISTFIFLLNLTFNNFFLLTNSKHNELVNNSQQLLNNLQPGIGNERDNIYFSDDGTLLKFKNQNLTGYIDLSIPKFKNLCYLNLYGNQITYINLVNLLKLETLFLKNNQLTEINLFKNKKLQSLDLSHNNLSVIDISHLSIVFYFNINNNKPNGTIFIDKM
jgi:hypothetical protein